MTGDRDGQGLSEQIIGDSTIPSTGVKLVV